MGIYSNVEKDLNESQFGGIKYRILFASAKAITSCPQLPVPKVTDEDYQIASGDFVFATVGDGFNVLEAINKTPGLDWESIGSPGSLKSKLMLEFDLPGMQPAKYRFMSLAKNDDLVLVLERTDCSGKRYLFGGCCSPAQIINYKGGTGKKPEDDVKTNFKLEAFADGLPVVLADGIVLPINENVHDDSFLLFEDGDAITTEDDDNIIY